ncbi:MAG: helix-turn-helix transcriptional regulator [Ruminococcaceae bacterium]|nr:helix-turn-helix transcriptional regulator [Oscillospiraceae bacterium]
MMTFKEKLVVLRKIKHLTQDEFASAVGVSRQAVYKWESGQSYPEVQKLIEMKMLFGISIDDLLDDTFEIELPKKKRKKRTPKVAQENAEAAPVAAPVVEAPKAAPVAAPVVEAPKAAPVAAPVVEAPKAAPVAAPVVEAPKAEPVAAPVVEEVKEEPVVEAPVVEEVKEEPVVEAPKAAPVAAPKAAPTIEINDPTGKYAKRGGLFGRIFGNKK